MSFVAGFQGWRDRSKTARSVSQDHGRILDIHKEFATRAALL